MLSPPLRERSSTSANRKSVIASDESNLCKQILGLSPSLAAPICGSYLQHLKLRYTGIKISDCITISIGLAVYVPLLSSSMRGSGRKNLKQGALQRGFDLQPGERICRAISLCGSNIIEVEDADLVKTLCLLPAKFNKIFWIRRGSFVVVQEGEREKALESGNKVTGIISQVLFEEQIRALRRSSMWPEAFEESKAQQQGLEEKVSNNKKESKRAPESSGSDDDSSEDEGLPPLHVNQNRRVLEFDQHESSSDEE